MLELVLLAASLVCACATTTGAPGSGAPSSGAGGPAAVVLGEPFTLRVGERRQVEGEDLEIRFAAVLSDSRCPRDVTCVWEGDAELEILLRRGGEGSGNEVTVHLHTHGGEAMPHEARAMGHTLRLEALEPVPVSTHRTAPEEYVATLLLR